MKEIIPGYNHFVGFMIVVFVLSVVSLDALSGIPIFVMISSGLYLLGYGWEHDWFSTIDESEE
jgi:hypothetical protein